MSAYYATGIRDWFVGVLFAVAACLYLYKGLTDKEASSSTPAASSRWESR